MYIAMNRFKVKKDCMTDFEQVWLKRESYLHTLPGFMVFHLLKGPEREDHWLYSSHTVWRNFSDFDNWTKSEAFRKAHAGAGKSAHAQVVTKGDISLALSGKGEGWDVGIAFGNFIISAR